MRLLIVTYTGEGYAPDAFYNKVKLFDAFLEVSRNAAAVSDAISCFTP